MNTHIRATRAGRLQVLRSYARIERSGRGFLTAADWAEAESNGLTTGFPSEPKVTVRNDLVPSTFEPSARSGVPSRSIFPVKTSPFPLTNTVSLPLPDLST